jgi:hypothetical protein
MGLLSFFNKPAPALTRLPSGSFSVDREGNLLASTVSSSFPADLLVEMAAQVLAAFRESAEANLPLSELHINYPSLTITARELRGGAILFLAPQTPYAQTLTQ